MSLLKERRQLKYHVVDALCLKPSLGLKTVILPGFTVNTHGPVIQACISSKPAPASTRGTVNESTVTETLSRLCFSGLQISNNVQLMSIFNKGNGPAGYFYSSPLPS